MGPDKPSVAPIKGRGIASQPASRFLAARTEPFDDGWEIKADPLATPAQATRLRPDPSRTIISRNRSPDLPFDRSINPYKGCEHGCVYCFARPSHAYLDLSPGLDFETQIYYKAQAGELLQDALRKRAYECRPIALGANTDPYQPAEREHRITRAILQTLAQCRHPVSIVTKGALVERDLDILSEMAEHQLAHVTISVTMLDPQLKRILEPRTPSPARRLKTIATLAAHGVPVSVLAAPMIPFVNDHELEDILQASYEAGARRAGYVLLRLPHELKQMFREWLDSHYPDRAEHVFSAIAQMRGGQAYDSRFGVRQRGTGVYADLLARRFSLACKRLGLNRRSLSTLRTDLFRPPEPPGQLSLLP